MAAVPKPRKPEPAGVAVREPDEFDLSWAQDLVERFGKKGPHAEYKKFAESTKTQTKTDAFTFIADACDSEGGFTDGRYIDAHTREQPNVPGISEGLTTTGGIGPSKLQERKKLSYFDNFSKIIRDAPWGYIQSQKDVIHRESNEAALEEFWHNTDGQGASIDDFNEEPQQQAQMYGTAIVVVDRPASDIVTAADENAEENQPYAYMVPTKNVVNWTFDERGELTGIAFLEPEDDEQPPEKSPVKVWTKACWARFELIAQELRGDSERDRYLMMEWGPNPIGKVPVAPLWVDRPKAKKLLGKSVMRDVAVINKTTFNLDSEIREVQRLCAFPIFCIPSKNPGSIKNVVVGTGSALGYNANAGEPKYVSADLNSLAVLRADRDKLTEAAYAMASLAAIVGYIQTSSGFHAEAEFEKTNKRIGRNAGSLEDYETRLAKLFLNWKGYTDQQIKDAQGLVSISYPKSFQIRDVDQLIKRTADQLDLELGDNANRRFLRDFFSALWPRLDKDEMDKLVEESARAVSDIQSARAEGGGSFLGAAGVAGTKQRVNRMLQGVAGSPPKGGKLAAAPEPKK